MKPRGHVKERGAAEDGAGVRRAVRLIWPSERQEIILRCAKHNLEAAGVCAWCGRAVCAQCPPQAAPVRLACSDACAASLARSEKALEALLQKSSQTLRASAFYCYLCAALSAAAAVGAYYALPSPFLIWFAAGGAAVLLASGLWYHRLARKTAG